MSRIGTGELLLILSVALIIFGPAKLPELGKVLGETIGNLKRQMNSVTEELDLDLTSSKPAKKKTTKTAKIAKSENTAEQETAAAVEAEAVENGKEEEAV